MMSLKQNTKFYNQCLIFFGGGSIKYNGTNLVLVNYFLRLVQIYLSFEISYADHNWVWYKR